MKQEKKLTYEEIYSVMDKPSKSEEQVHEETVEFLTRTQGKGNFKIPEKVETDAETIDDLKEQLAEGITSKSEMLEELVDVYGEAAANAYMKQVAFETDDDYKYYKQLDEDERRVLKKLQRAHPDQGWNAQKYLKNTK